MAISSIDKKFKKPRARVESLKMAKEEKITFFWSEWNRICENKKKEKVRQAILQDEREKSEAEWEKLEYKRKKISRKREKKIGKQCYKLSGRIYNCNFKNKKKIEN